MKKIIIVILVVLSMTGCVVAPANGYYGGAVYVRPAPVYLGPGAYGYRHYYAPRYYGR